MNNLSLVGEESYLALQRVKLMLDGIVDNDLDKALKEVEETKSQFQTKEFAELILRHTLNRLFFRATKLTIIFFNNVSVKNQEEEKILKEYTEQAVIYSLEKYNQVWDVLTEKIEFDDLNHNLNTLLRLDDAYGDVESLNKLIEEMPTEANARFEYILKTAYN